jgi:hypothetical protein
MDHRDPGARVCNVCRGAEGRVQRGVPSKNRRCSRRCCKRPVAGAGASQQMLTPPMSQPNGGGSLNGSRESSTLPLKTPKKSVRFSSDTTDAGESSADGTHPAADAAESSRGNCQRPGIRTAGDSGVYSPVVGGEGYSEVKAAETDKKCGENAGDAERHGMLPTWRIPRLKMPVVEWWVHQAGQHAVRAASICRT